MAKVKAKLKNLRISPRKVRLVVNLIKGMDVENALVQLSSTVKGSSRNIEKLLKSAIANAENNNGLDRKNLFISDIQVGEGPIMKRWLPRAYGRATQILKRTSIVFMTLDEKSVAESADKISGSEGKKESRKKRNDKRNKRENEKKEADKNKKDK